MTSIFRRSFLAGLCAGVLLSPSISIAEASPQPNLRDISQWFNGIETMQSRFQQYNEDGTVDTGTLYIRRPGRLRMEYDKPEAVVFVSGGAITISDPKSKGSEKQTYPLRSTPLWHLLRKDVDLGRPGAIKSFEQHRDLTRITAYDDDAPEAGRIVFEFENGDGTIKLAGWNIRTANGEKVLVRLRQPEYGMALSNFLFSPDVPNR